MTQLVIHGLSALSVFGDQLGARALAFGSMLVGLVGILSAIVVGVRVFTRAAVPGWATFTIGLLAVVALQAVLLVAVFVLSILNSRQMTGVIPLRDHALYILRVDRAG